MRMERPPAWTTLSILASRSDWVRLLCLPLSPAIRFVFQRTRLPPITYCQTNAMHCFGRVGCCWLQVGYLRVEAEASTDLRPLPGFTPRRGEGLPFGLLGRSSTAPPAKPGLRIDFQFDRAAFSFRVLPVRIPYPVPFRLLGDEAKVGAACTNWCIDSDVLVLSTPRWRRHVPPLSRVGGRRQAGLPGWLFNRQLSSSSTAADLPHRR